MTTQEKDVLFQGMSFGESLRYAVEELGFSVIPLREGGKSPYVKWKINQEKAATLKQVNAWVRQFRAKLWAVVTGEVSGVFTLDFDGAEGIATRKLLGLEPHVRSGSGGEHVYFKHPGTRIPTRNHKADEEMGGRWPGMDVKGDGGYAAFLGENKNGPYRWLRPLDLYEIGDLPQALQDYLTKQPGQTQNDQPKNTHRQSGDINLAAALVSSALKKVAGGAGRNDTGIWLACQLRDLPLPIEAARVHMLYYTAQVPDTNAHGETEAYTEQEAEASLLQAYKRPPRSPLSQSQPPATYPCTDLGNAERFAYQHGKKARWCEIWKCWMVFNGRCWGRDVTGKVDQLAKETALSILIEAKNAPTDELRAALAKHAIATASNMKIKAMLERAKSELPCTPDDFNRQLDALNFLNGTLDLKTGILKKHDPEDMLTRCIRYNYDPGATCPIWEGFIDWAFAGDDELTTFVQQAIGMSVSGDIREQCWFPCHGDGNNGKSTFLSTISNILGEYAHTAKIESFQTKHDERANYDQAEFYGKRLITASETQPGKRLNEALMKKITGGERLRAERKYEHEFEFMPECTIWLAVNHRPVVKDTSKGMWRRVRYIPFTQTIADKDVDRELPSKLMAEAEGIIAWVVEGCMQWYQKGRLEVPNIVKNATEQYRMEQDTIARFLCDECIFTQNDADITGVGSLYPRYDDWCSQQDIKPDRKMLKDDLIKRGFEYGRIIHGGKYGFRRLKLKDASPDGGNTSSPSGASGEANEKSNNRKEQGGEPSYESSGEPGEPGEPNSVKFTRKGFTKETLGKTASPPSPETIKQVIGGLVEPIYAGKGKNGHVHQPSPVDDTQLVDFTLDMGEPVSHDLKHPSKPPLPPETHAATPLPQPRRYIPVAGRYHDLHLCLSVEQVEKKGSMVAKPCDNQTLDGKGFCALHEYKWRLLNYVASIGAPAYEETKTSIGACIEAWEARVRGMDEKRCEDIQKRLLRLYGVGDRS